MEVLAGVSAASRLLVLVSDVKMLVLGWLRGRLLVLMEEVLRVFFLFCCDSTFHHHVFYCFFRRSRDSLRGPYRLVRCEVRRLHLMLLRLCHQRILGKQVPMTLVHLLV